MENLSATLRAAREERGITIEDIAHATSINVRVIAAIEAGNYSVLPEAYIKAFIRSYARTVGIDEGYAVSLYVTAKFEKTEAVEQEPPASPVVVYEKIDPALAQRPDIWAHAKKGASKLGSATSSRWQQLAKRGRSAFEHGTGGTNPTLVVVMSLLAMSFFVFAYFTLQTNSSSSTKLIPKPESQTFSSPPLNSEVIPVVKADSIKKNITAKVDEAKEQKGKVVATIPKKNELALDIVVKGDTWVSVVSDDFATDRGQRKPGKLGFTAKEKFLINIGNVKAVSLLLNGKPLSLPTEDGFLRDFVIAREQDKIITHAGQLKKQKQVPVITERLTKVSPQVSYVPVDTSRRSSIKKKQPKPTRR